MKFKCKKRKRKRKLIKCIVKVYFWDYKKYVSLKKKVVIVFDIYYVGIVYFYYNICFIYIFNVEFFLFIKWMVFFLYLLEFMEGVYICVSEFLLFIIN